MEASMEWVRRLESLEKRLVRLERKVEALEHLLEEEEVSPELREKLAKMAKEYREGRLELLSKEELKGLLEE